MQETRQRARVAELAGVSFTAMGMAGRAAVASANAAGAGGPLTPSDPSIFAWVRISRQCNRIFVGLPTMLLVGGDAAVLAISL